MLQNLNQLQAIPDALKGDLIERAFERIEFIKLPKVEQDKYHKNLTKYQQNLENLIKLHQDTHSRLLQRLKLPQREPKNGCSLLFDYKLTSKLLHTGEQLAQIR